MWIQIPRTTLHDLELQNPVWIPDHSYSLLKSTEILTWISDDIWKNVVRKDYHEICFMLIPFPAPWWLFFLHLAKEASLVFLSGKSINMHGYVMTSSIFQLLLNNKIKIACTNLTSSLRKPVSLAEKQGTFFFSKRTSMIHSYV